MSYKIITDSCANLTAELIKKFNIDILPLEYLIDDISYQIKADSTAEDYKTFYSKMREGKVAKTSMANGENFRSLFENILNDGKDILYIGFSSALSGTYQSVKNTLNDLAEEYPDRKCIAIDSLAAAMGQGLLVAYAVQQQQEGKSIDEVAAWLEENKLRLCHLFTVDDLKYLRRGGRISGATALIGTVLQIKPLMHVDNEGRLVAFGKVRGRKTSIETLLERMADTIENPTEQMIYIVHGDCEDEAKALAKEIKTRFKPKSVTMNFVDQVIGAHSGPGTLAMFYLGNER